jgi:hypothetical protein
MPSGRALDISADQAGVRFIETLLRDIDSRPKPPPGRLGDFPTQAATDALLAAERRKIAQQCDEILAEKEERRKAEVRSTWEKKGVNIDAVKFTI